MENGYARERIWWHRLTFFVVLIAVILHFRTSWRIEQLGENSARDVHEAVAILAASQAHVERAGENSDRLVAQGDQLLAEFRNRFDQLEWRLTHPLDALLGWQPQEVRSIPKETLSAPKEGRR